MSAARGHWSGPREAGPDERWELVLYVAGRQAASRAARASLERLCRERLAGEYEWTVEVVDLRQCPERAGADQIFAVPTLVRRHPLPERKLLGDLDDIDAVASALGLPDPVRLERS